MGTLFDICTADVSFCAGTLAESIEKLTDSLFVVLH